jgi:chondroitin 4-sulfotransferase 11
MQKLRAYVGKYPRLMELWHYTGRFVDTLRRLCERGAYMSWSYLISDEKKVIYIVMQKVACTSIKASMAGIQSDENYLSVIDTIRSTGRVVSAIDTAACDGYFVFTFVRNPFERLVSCYENKYHTDRKLLSKNMRHMKFDYYLLGYLRKDRGFLHFARRVCRIPDRLADHHFINQGFLIDRMGQNPKPDFVGHFERLEEEYEPIRQKYGFLPLPHHNKTPKARSWMDYYDLPTAKMVYRRYKKDIERFGYQDTYAQLISHLEAKQKGAPTA